MERVPTYRPVAKPTRKLHPWSFCGDEGTLLLEALTRKCLKVLDVKFESMSAWPHLMPKCMIYYTAVIQSTAGLAEAAFDPVRLFHAQACYWITQYLTSLHLNWTIISTHVTFSIGQNQYNVSVFSAQLRLFYVSNSAEMYSGP